MVRASPAYAPSSKLSDLVRSKYEAPKLPAKELKISPHSEPPPYTNESQCVSTKLGGGVNGKMYGGVAYGWRPMPANPYLPDYVTAGLSPKPALGSMITPYVTDYKTVHMMSFDAPCWAPSVPRRHMKADGVQGEFLLRPRVVHRSIAGHEARPTPDI